MQLNISSTMKSWLSSYYKVTDACWMSADYTSFTPLPWPHHHTLPFTAAGHVPCASGWCLGERNVTLTASGARRNPSARSCGCNAATRRQHLGWGPGRQRPTQDQVFLFFFFFLRRSTDKQELRSCSPRIGSSLCWRLVQHRFKKDQMAPSQVRGKPTC